MEMPEDETFTGGWRGADALLPVKWSTMNDKLLYGCSAAAADAGSGVGDIRAADERGEPDTQDHVAHSVAVDVWSLPSDACWRNWKGISSFTSRKIRH